MGIVNTEIKQKTIEKAISLTGVGLHTGKDVTLTFKPSLANSGLAFKRVDLEGSPVIEADANYVTSTQRGTCLEKEWCFYSNFRACISGFSRIGH